jgi:S-adenosylmethionine decarboxylase
MQTLIEPTEATDAQALQFCGQHLLAEVHGVDFDVLNDADYLGSLLEEAVERAGATACGELRKKFDPQGVTILILLEESHASLHSYPEAGSMFLDIFTCGTRCKPRHAFDYIVGALRSEQFTLKVLTRGTTDAAIAIQPDASEVCA